MDERRIAKRVKIRKEVAKSLKFAHLSNLNDGKLSGELIDISDNGLSFTSRLNLEELLGQDDILSVWLNFIKSKTSVFTVEVRHITNNICGCRIIERE